MDYKIDAGVPMPAPKSGRGRRASKYPVSAMAIGDSFFAKRESGLTAEQHRNRIAAAVCRYGKRWGLSFSTRLEDGGVRVWRTK